MACKSDGIVEQNLAILNCDEAEDVFWANSQAYSVNTLSNHRKFPMRVHCRV